MPLSVTVRGFWTKSSVYMLHLCQWDGRAIKGKLKAKAFLFIILQFLSPYYEKCGLVKFKADGA